MTEVPPQPSRFERWLEAGLIGVFLTALVLNLGNALLRSAFQTSVLWADEVQQFSLVWLAFLGAALATAQDNHLRVDVLRNRLKGRVRQLVSGFEALLLPALCGFAAVHSARYVEQMASLGARSEMAGLPMWLPHASVTLGFGLMAGLELLRVPRKFAGARA